MRRAFPEAFPQEGARSRADGQGNLVPGILVGLVCESMFCAQGQPTGLRAGSSFFRAAWALGWDSGGPSAQTADSKRGATRWRSRRARGGAGRLPRAQLTCVRARDAGDARSRFSKPSSPAPARPILSFLPERLDREQTSFCSCSKMCICLIFTFLKCIPQLVPHHVAVAAWVPQEADRRGWIYWEGRVPAQREGGKGLGQAEGDPELRRGLNKGLSRPPALRLDGPPPRRPLGEGLPSMVPHEGSLVRAAGCCRAWGHGPSVPQASGWHPCHLPSKNWV